jgi:hypothetical protein
MRTVFSILLFVTLLCGCGGSNGGSNGNADATGVELTYHRSGGLPGIDETLRVHRSGSATLETGLYPVGEGESRTIRFRLRPEDAARLRAALAGAGFDELRLSEPESACVDCLVYELATPANQLRFDQVTAPPELEPVLARLDAIVAAHRPGGWAAHRPFHSGSRFSKKAVTPSRMSSVEKVRES